MANQFIGGALKRNQTLITFDNGAQWHKIAAPINDINGVPLNCKVVRKYYIRRLLIDY